MSFRFVILPHAGGAGHAYQPLARHLPAWLDPYCHDLPGHGRRAREPLLQDMEALARDLQDHIGPLNGHPWVLFGHSLGALLAHALIRLRRHRGLSPPALLFASGTASPAAGKRRPAIARLPSADFWAQVSTYGGLPEAVLQAGELRDYFETILRGDFAAVEGYAPPPALFEAPIHVLFGREDISDEAAGTWRLDTSAELRRHPFAGGHFYLFEHPAEIGRLIAEIVEPVRACRAAF